MHPAWILPDTKSRRLKCGTDIHPRLISVKWWGAGAIDSGWRRNPPASVSGLALWNAATTRVWQLKGRFAVAPDAVYLPENTTCQPARWVSRWHKHRRASSLSVCSGFQTILADGWSDGCRHYCAPCNRREMGWITAIANCKSPEQAELVKR